MYVLEFLLGQYCSSDDEMVIEKGVQNVKRILADNFVRPDESQKILSQLRKKGSHTIIDMVTVHLDMKRDCFFAEFSNLGIGNVPITDEYPEKFDRLLCGGIWCIVQLDYEVEDDNNFGIEDIDGNPLRSKQKKQNVIFQAGRYRSSDRNILQMITVLLVIIWLNLSENFARNNMVMHLIIIFVWEEI